jgi:hypothetical protein
MIIKKFIITPYYLKKLKVDVVHELSVFSPSIFDIFRKYKSVSTFYDITPIIFPDLH